MSGKRCCTRETDIESRPEEIRKQRSVSVRGQVYVMESSGFSYAGDRKGCPHEIRSAVTRQTSRSRYEPWWLTLSWTDFMTPPWEIGRKWRLTYAASSVGRNRRREICWSWPAAPAPF